MRLIDYFDRGWELGPDAACFTEGTCCLSYAQVKQDSFRIAHGLTAAGLAPGDIVASLTPNHLRAFEPAIGIQRAGMVWQPLNVRFGTDELVHALSSCDCSFLFFHSSLEAQVSEILTRCPTLRGAVAVDAPAGVYPGLDEWMAIQSSEKVDVQQGPQTTVRLASSGGTTGPSKGIVQTNQTIETMMACMLAVIPLGQRPVLLAAAPLSHMAGAFCWPVMLHGGETVVMAKAEPEAVLRSIPAHDVTFLTLTPTMLYMLLDSPELGTHDYGSLRQIVYGGAPMSVDKLRRAMQVFGPVMTQVFGQAEASLMCTVLTPQDHAAAVAPGGDPGRLLSCGRITPFVRLGIMAEDGSLLADGVRGEIVVQSNLVMPGYYRNEKATAAVRRNGWHLTGDVGYRDPEGFYYIVDRKRDMIVSGGFNIFPTEIEQALWTHPAVKDCAVIGVPDAKWGEAVKAVVELNAGQSASERELIDLCRDRVGAMKAPKSVEIWQELPRSAVGKVLKREIRMRYWSSEARSI